jgi:hypothetical protein
MNKDRKEYSSSKKVWLRIWIVLSVVFLIFSSFYAIKQENETHYRVLVIYKSFCDRPGYTPEVTTDCLNSAEKDADKVRQIAGGKFEAIIFLSVVPLLLLWLFGFIFWKIYQWIKNGFKKN